MESLAAKDEILYAGGILTGSVRGQGINGIIAYDLKRNGLSVDQPPPLTGETVQVKAMDFNPEGVQLYIAGNFEGTGSVECPGVCVYDHSLQRWSRPGTELSGSVAHLVWMDRESLFAAGNIVIGSVRYSMATFYVPNGVWAPFREDQAFPGEITAMSPADNGGQSGDWSSDSMGFWIAGLYAKLHCFSNEMARHIVDTNKGRFWNTKQDHRNRTHATGRRKK
ncbi:MAG: hypothetical protein Q9226_002380 [Calogaya cf. arnoldii]